MLKERDFSYKEYKEKIIPIIKEKNGIVMPADIALKTNYPLIHIKYSLNKLAAEYYADITPTDDGDLLYKFDPNVTNLSKSLKRFMKPIGKWLLGASKTLFKIIIMLMLIGYMVFYVLAIIGLIAAATASDSDSDFDAGDLILGVFRVIFEMLYYMFIFSYDPYAAYNTGEKKRPFYIRVFSFVFGDDQKDPVINHEGNLLRYLKMHKQITFSEALNITGESDENIKSLLVNLTVKYDGDIEVNDDGIIVYKFENLNFTDENNEELSYVWDRKLIIPKLNYNKKSENGWIIAFNTFNLVVSFIATFFMSSIDPSISLPAIITTVPLVYSILFFAIPIFRSFSLKKRIPKILVYNDFSEELYKVKQLKGESSHIPVKNMKLETSKYFYENYPDIFTYDFQDDLEILDATNYHNELIS